MSHRLFLFSVVFLTLLCLPCGMAFSQIPLPEYHPSVAFDSQNNRYLVVYERGDSSHIYGKLLNRDGTLAQGPFLISPDTSIQHSPAVAYDGINQRFLVVWENDNLNNGIDIYGRFVNANGSLWGNDFCVSNILDYDLGLIPAPEGQWNPAVAFDGVNQRFLVVWHDDRNSDSSPDIYGQMVNADDGSFLGTGDSFVISGDLSEQWSPRLAYDSVNQIYLVAWVDYRNGEGSGSDIYGQLVDKDGNLVGTSSDENRVISSAPDDQRSPSIASGTGSGGPEFLVTWLDFRNSTLSNPDASNIYGQLVAPGGSLRGSSFPVSDTFDFISEVREKVTDVAFDGLGKFLVVWQDYRNFGATGADIDGQFVNGEGHPVKRDGTNGLDNFPVYDSDVQEHTPSIASNSNDANFLVAFVTNESGSPLIGFAFLGGIINVSPEDVVFGNVLVGTSSDRTVTVANEGAADLILGTIGNPVAPFSRAGGTCLNGLRVGPGGNCTIVVRFLPTATGNFSSSFGIPSNDPEESLETVTLSGTGIQQDITVTPTGIAFGGVLVGTSSDKTVTVTNDGTANLVLVTIGSPLAPFSRAGGSCDNGQVLTPGASCTIIVRFSPQTPNVPYNGSFNIPSNDPDAFENPVIVSLSGLGIQQDITVTPLSVGFGDILVGTSSDRTVTVKNDGTADLLLGTIGILTAPFSRAGGDCINGQTLIPGGSCTIIVRFSPVATGFFNSSFGIPSNDPDESLVNVALSGTGIQQDIAVTPMSVKFGAVKKKERADQTITVRNEGTADLTLGTIGSPSTPFSRAGGTCTNSMILTPGESCSIVVRFDPVETGSFSSSFNVSSNDPDESSLAVNLRGGSGPDLTGGWLSFNKDCRTTKKGIKCKVKARFKVDNIGTEGAPPTCVKFVLGEEGVPLDDSHPFLEIESTYLFNGKSQTVSPRFSLPVGESGNGKQILAVVDCCGVVLEADETNNVIPWSMGP